MILLYEKYERERDILRWADRSRAEWFSFHSSVPSHLVVVSLEAERRGEGACQLVMRFVDMRSD